MTPASFFEFWSDAFVVKCRLCRIIVDYAEDIAKNC